MVNELTPRCSVYNDRKTSTTHSPQEERQSGFKSIRKAPTGGRADLSTRITAQTMRRTEGSRDLSLPCMVHQKDCKPD